MNLKEDKMITAPVVIPLLINGVGIQELLTKTVLAIIIIVAGVVAATKFKNGGVRETAGIVAVVLIALLIVGIAGHIDQVANSLYNLIFGGK